MADFDKYYRAYMYMRELLQNDYTHNYITSSFRDSDKGEDFLVGKTDEKVIDTKWVEAVEDALPYMRKAIDEQRRFIKQTENVVRIEKAKKVGAESVKHLSQHTEFIDRVEGDTVTPNRLLVSEQEESFAIYENRVLLTLIRRALNFVDEKYSAMKEAPSESHNSVKLSRTLELDGMKFSVTVDYTSESQSVDADTLEVVDVSKLSDFDRIRRIRSLLNSLLNTKLMQEISKEPDIRVPITQTNLLKKNPNFQKVMELWYFFDSYKRTGFEIVSEEFKGAIPENIKNDIYLSMEFQHFIMNLATNSGLRKMLGERLEEENRILAEERKKPEKMRLAAMRARIDEIRKEEAEIRLKEIRERDKRILELSSEVEDLKNTLRLREEMIVTFKCQIAELGNKISALLGEIENAKQQITEKERENRILSEENAELKSEVEKVREEINLCNGKIGRLMRDCDELKEKNGLIEAENLVLRQDLSDKEHEIAELRKTVLEYEKTVSENRAEISELSEKNALLCEQNSEKNEIIGRVNDEVVALKLKTEQVSEEHRRELAAVKSEYELCIAAMKKQSEDRIASLEKAHSAETEKLNNVLADSKARHTAYISKLNSEFSEMTERIRKKQTDELQKCRADYESKLSAAEKAGANSIQTLAEKYASDLLKAEKAFNKRVDSARKSTEKEFDSKFRESERLHSLEITELKRKHRYEMHLSKLKSAEEIKKLKWKAQKQ